MPQDHGPSREPLRECGGPWVLESCCGQAFGQERCGRKLCKVWDDSALWAKRGAMSSPRLLVEVWLEDLEALGGWRAMESKAEKVPNFESFQS